MRDDGYHQLHTVFQAVALHEEVTLRESTHSGIPITISGHDAHRVPTDSTNLAVRALRAVHTFLGLDNPRAAAEVPPVEIHLNKGVPVAGGMAGGSADAAAMLLAAVEFYCSRHPATRHLQPPTPQQLIALAAGLGADVPFCLLGGTALGTGRGDELISVVSHGPFHWALATDKRGLSTPAVFRHLDERFAAAAPKPTSHAQAGSSNELLRALALGDPQQLAPLLINDLQASAISLMPSLRETLAAAKEAEALAAIVSGSGPTIAMLCRDAEHALDVATAVSVAGKASATLTTTSPAGPARLVPTKK